MCYFFVLGSGTKTWNLRRCLAGKDVVRKSVTSGPQSFWSKWLPWYKMWLWKTFESLSILTKMFPNHLFHTVNICLYLQCMYIYEFQNQVWDLFKKENDPFWRVEKVGCKNIFILRTKKIRRFKIQKPVLLPSVTIFSIKYCWSQQKLTSNFERRMSLVWKDVSEKLREKSLWMRLKPDFLYKNEECIW